MASQPRTPSTAIAAHPKLAFNADAVAIAIALALAALIRLNIIHRVGW